MSEGIDKTTESNLMLKAGIHIDLAGGRPICSRMPPALEHSPLPEIVCSIVQLLWVDVFVDLTWNYGLLLNQ